MRLPALASRVFVLLLAVMMVMAQVTDVEAKEKKRTKKKQQTVSRASGVNDPRYAAVIMNPLTGEIYHQQNANERRYPASLTKIMTLYLLFDALEKKEIDLDDRMEVSALAAKQAQTNLSLDAGDRIDVETAIKSLVVRSANDVSVVVAERLGGSVDGFARQMTNQARKLGMMNTIFRNPNGLPNTGQVTTAMDMAKLGIAVKRDFPDYYHYFSTLQFSHNGVTYYTHNRVLLRYAGAEGIKTGYIGASGFNLVTSVVRGGRPLVGVVMGGGSGGWRDNRMIALLDQTYQSISQRGAARGKPAPANLPLSQKPQPKKTNTAQSEIGNDLSSLAATKALLESTEMEDSVSADSVPADTLPGATIPAARHDVRTVSPFDTADAPVNELPAPPAPADARPISRAPIIITPRTNAPSQSRVIELAPDSAAPPVASAPSAIKPVPETMVMQTPTSPVHAAPASVAEPIQLANPPALNADAGWGIQVGAFSSQALAEQAARSALQLAAKPLATGRLAIMGPNHTGVPVHRARIENISQIQARKACELLIQNNSPCFIFKAAP
jgi:D-alanyl-D-alanine carboxypeptidase